jgi:DNA gyrase/topoisomerase IV subunit B
MMYCTSVAMAEIQQYDQRTHVLERPSMYIGPVDKSDRQVWVQTKIRKRWSSRFLFFRSHEDRR